MKNKKLYNLIFASLFAALICLFNVVIHIPTPGGNGFFNIGDAFVLLGGVFLGPYGIASAIIGGVLSDVILGYALYAPATAILKGICGLIIFLMTKKSKKISAFLPAALLGEIVISAGYFVYEYFAISLREGAIMNIPANLIQGAVSIVLALFLMKPIRKILIKGENNL